MGGLDFWVSAPFLQAFQTGSFSKLESLLGRNIVRHFFKKYPKRDNACRQLTKISPMRLPRIFGSSTYGLDPICRLPADVPEAKAETQAWKAARSWNLASAPHALTSKLAPSRSTNVNPLKP